VYTKRFGMDKNTHELIKELPSQLWFQTYRSYAQYSADYRQLPIDQLLPIIEIFQPQYYSDIQRFLKQPFFLDSNSGIHLLKEIQKIDEMRIRYESDKEHAEKRIESLIENIKTNISQHNG
jgi:uncharacterized FlaG/YvyC family protein